MSVSDVEILKSTLQTRWSSQPSQKAAKYVNKFFDATRSSTKITAKVLGNHGTYTVSIQLDKD